MTPQANDYDHRVPYTEVPAAGRVGRQFRCPASGCHRLVLVRSRIGFFDGHTVTCSGCRTIWEAVFLTTGNVDLTDCGLLR